MKLDSLWLSDPIGEAEKRAGKRTIRSVRIIEDARSTLVQCGPTRVASAFSAGFALFVILSFVTCVIGSANSLWLLLAVVGLVGTAVIRSARESVIVTTAEIRISRGLRPFRKTVIIRTASVRSVQVGAFRDASWDPHVEIRTADRTFRFAAGVSEGSARQIVQAIRRWIPGV
ncbi:MAG: hypothetical protein QOK37_3222 [Thermoanaerobaculia bacterium]|jgi:hypothetical protein|nr:hypothetical protein [Thermoanaerobaculia bacterium]